MSLSVSDANFDTEVLASSVPVLVHFWAPWCGICRMIEPLLQSFQHEWAGQLCLVDVNRLLGGVHHLSGNLLDALLPSKLLGVALHLAPHEAGNFLQFGQAILAPAQV
jgi:thiol-disulfide isomerase/thioredoxin